MLPAFSADIFGHSAATAAGGFGSDTTLPGNCYFDPSWRFYDLCAINRRPLLRNPGRRLTHLAGLIRFVLCIL